MEISDPEYLAEVKKRFWSKVKINHETGCWEWQGTKYQSGYGAFWLAGSPKRAHRLSFYWETGLQPECVCHHCDNPACVNPAHLFAGNQSANMLDCSRKGRHFAPRGELQGASKLTEADVREIWARCKSGETQRSIAKDLAVSQQHVCDIANGKRWHWLTSNLNDDGTDKT